jgi:hypothetical protein
MKYYVTRRVWVEQNVEGTWDVFCVSSRGYPFTTREALHGWMDKEEAKYFVRTWLKAVQLFGGSDEPIPIESKKSIEIAYAVYASIINEKFKELVA